MITKTWLMGVIFMGVLFFQGSFVQAAELNGLYDHAGQKISVRQAAKSFSGYDVIIFGEYHDNAEIHQQELLMMGALYRENKQLALSLEMFERDVQDEVNQYLAGGMTEEVFLAAARPWENYEEAYRPCVLLAKEANLPVLASNLPRYLAARYAKEQTLAKFTVKEQLYLPRRHDSEKGAYYELFSDYMLSGQTGMKMDAQRAEAFYRAQCLKDDTMAESIIQFLKRNPSRQVYHLQGEFHSRARLGVVAKIKALEPALKVAVIYPVYVRDEMALREAAKQLAAGDLLYAIIK